VAIRQGRALSSYDISQTVVANWGADSQIAMRRIWNAILTVFALALLATLGGGCWNSNSRLELKPPQDLGNSGSNHLDSESRRLAGPHAIDCGRVSLNGNPEAATKCALLAQKAGKPFRVRYDLQGIDSEVALAIIRSPVGTVCRLLYDSDPSGGGRRGGGVVLSRKCPDPGHLWVDSGGRIDCLQKESSPPAIVMCPNADPY
jgi:hypothetical protein